MSQINPLLKGRLILYMDIHCRTGLHIGGLASDTKTVPLDNPIIRDPIRGIPYIPGTSLRGKMRSQWEKALGATQNELFLTDGSPVRIHTIESSARAIPAIEIDLDPVCRIFGVSGDQNPTLPSRLTVTDFHLSAGDQKRLHADGNVSYSEVKTEVSIDRLTHEANPRSNERVSAAVRFSGGRLIYRVFGPADIAYFEDILAMLLLLQGDALGGSGSRGYGMPHFEQLRLTGNRAMQAQEYTLANEPDVVTMLRNWSETAHKAAEYLAGGLT